ncbi:MAG: hypothetical protein E7394_08725 [Ruminococcaceae bacterium]|nr:hypothetical protein [Oscillospiraceae bacterium]
MKKVFILLLSLFLLLSFFGCAEKAEEKLPREKGDKTYTNSKSNKKEKKENIPKGLKVNSYYLDLLGEEKEDIDELLGIGEYSDELGMTDYKIGVMIGWNSLGFEPEEDSEAVSISLTLENVFHNCPQTLTTEEISSLFPDSYVEYSPMDDENVLNVNYNGLTLSFYPDLGLKPDSYAFINSMNKYALPSGEYYDGEITEEDIRPDESYYEYAVSHDGEFWDINKDWRDDREYYYLADVDRDSKQEMVVKLGCGLAIYKKTGSGVEEVYKNTLPDSSGSVSYYVANYDGVDYIAYNSASSSGYTVLYKLSGNELVKARVSQTIDGEYFIDDAKVSLSQYESYLDSISYPVGMKLEELK